MSNNQGNPIVLAEALTAACVREFARCSAIKLSPEAMAVIIAEEPRLEEDLMNMYGLATDSLDTADREFLLDVVAKHFTGRHWPTYGEQNDGSFIATLREKALEAGAEILTGDREVPVQTHWIGKSKLPV